MKKELLEKIYRQIIECEKDLEEYSNDKKHYLGNIKELEQNIAFCYELIDIIVEK